MDSCELRTTLPETGATNPWCRTSTGFVTRYTGLGSYTLPKVDVLLSWDLSEATRAASSPRTTMFLMPRLRRRSDATCQTTVNSRTST